MGNSQSFIKENLLVRKCLSHGDIYNVNENIHKIKNFNAVIDNIGNTILHILLEYNKVELFIQVINEYKLDYKIKNNAGNTPFDSLILNNNSLKGLSVLDKVYDIPYTDKNIYGISLFNRLCYREGNINILKELYTTKRVYFDIPLLHNFYPILVFAMKNDNAILEFIMDNPLDSYDINYNVENDFGCNILHYLCFHNNINLIVKLYDMMTISNLVNKRNNNGDSAIDIAIKYKFNGIIEFFTINELIDYETTKATSYKAIIDVILKSSPIVKVPYVVNDSNVEPLGGLLVNKNTDNLVSDLLSFN